MAQSKNTGYGIALSRVTGGPTAIGQIKSITCPGWSREKVNATDLDDTVQAWIPGNPPDKGELSVEMYWTPDDTVDSILDDDFDAGTIASWKFVFPSPISKTSTFSAWIKDVTPATADGANALVRTIVFVLTTTETYT